MSTQARPKRFPDIVAQKASLKAGAAKTLQIVLAVGVLFDRHLACHPRERNIGLRAAQLLERRLGDRALPGHAGGSGEHPVRADEIAAQPDALAREAHRLVVIAPDELGVSSDSVVERRERIARAQTQRAPCREA